jgi:HK97 family phage major capsid protein
MTETTAANPELLADQVSSLLFQPLEAASVVLSSGPRIFDTGVLRMPKLVSGSTPTFVGAGGDIPDTADVDFDEVVLLPAERKSIKTIILFTNELVRQSVIGIDAVLKARLIKDVPDALDTALLTGLGTSNSITGIINQDDVQPSAWVPSDPHGLLDAIGLAVAAEVNPNRWFINGADFITLRKVKEASGSKKYVLESDLTKDATYWLFSIEVVRHKRVAAGHSNPRRHESGRDCPRPRALGHRAERAVRGNR